MKWTLVGLVVVGASLTAGVVVGAPTAQAPQSVPRDVQQALEPLRSLSPQQMHAVASLILADRAGLDIRDYCPPLKQVAMPERFPCLGAMISYASAVKECEKDGTPPQRCVKAELADSEWASCTFQNMDALLQRIRGLPVPPPVGPGPQPRPVRPPA